MSSTCKIRHVNDFERKHVAKNDRARWWVECHICPGSGVSAMFPGQPSPIGYAPDHATAIAFATAHATLHRDQTCPTCQHVPEVTVSLKDTQALVKARGA